MSWDVFALDRRTKRTPRMIHYSLGKFLKSQLRIFLKPLFHFIQSIQRVCQLHLELQTRGHFPLNLWNYSYNTIINNRVHSRGQKYPWEFSETFPVSIVERFLG